MINIFSQKTQEELKFYVYILIDPRDGKIFYVGKGYGNRVFSHLNDALVNARSTDKLETIRATQAANLNVRHYIVKHGLDESTAFIIESVLIDFLTFKDFSDVAKITNIVSGHHSFDQGIKTVDECEVLYHCPELKSDEIIHNILIININKTYDHQRKKKTDNPIYVRPNIYEATRGWWVLNPERAVTAEFVLAEYKGIVRAVFKPIKWEQNDQRADNRWGFVGEEVNEKEILDRYLNKAVPKTQGAANPIRYFKKSTCSFE